MTHSRRWHSSTTQVYRTCKALIEGRSISHKTSIREVKGGRRSAICRRLREQYCWPIVARLNGTNPAKLDDPSSARALLEGREGGAS